MDEVVLISDPAEIRHLFNASGYEQKASTEKFRIAVEGYSHEPPDWLPYCSASCMLEYLDGDEKVATVHQYWPSNGPKTPPDPKWLKLDGIIYRLIRLA